MNLLLAGALAVLLFAAFSSVGVEASNNGGYVFITPITPSEQIGPNQLQGPETVVFDDQGFLYTGIGDGSIRKVDLATNTSTVYAYTVNLANRTNCGNVTSERICGRPLGLRFDKNYNLYVCDAYYGLLFVPRNNPANVTVLANRSNDGPFGFTNALVINKAQDTIYFTDTSPTDPRSDFLRVFLEAKPQGRLIRYIIATGETTTLLTGLVFGNGVEFNNNETELIINETSLKRVRRYYLTGTKAGQNDFFNSDIGGYPDNVEYDPDTGLFLLGCYSQSLPDVDAFVNGTSKTQTYAYVISKIPANGYIAALDSTGAVVRTIYDAVGLKVKAASEAKRTPAYLRAAQGDYIYVGSVENPYLLRIPACLLTTTLVVPGVTGVPGVPGVTGVPGVPCPPLTS